MGLESAIRQSAMKNNLSSSEVIEVEIVTSQYDRAISRFTFESEQQVTRNNFYMVFQGVASAGYFSVIEQIDNFYLLCISMLFFIISYCQSKNAAASVRHIIVTYDRVRFLEYEIKKFFPHIDLSVYTNVDDVSLMKKKGQRIWEEKKGISRIFAFRDSVVHWFVSRNLKIATNNLYAAWAFLLFWAVFSGYSVYQILMKKYCNFEEFIKVDLFANFLDLYI